MSNPKTVLITGAAGNLGGKLRSHLENLYRLRLLDIQPRSEMTQADLSIWDNTWTDLFNGVEAVVHLAADPTAFQTWHKLIAPNMDALVNVFAAAAKAGVKRVVYASSNHVMGGYQNEPDARELSTDLPPRPGTQYRTDGMPRDSTPYGAAKLMGERIGKCFSDIYGLSVIAVRIGWVRPGENRLDDLPTGRGAWFRLMWLSNRDFCQLMERCIEADPGIRFAVINGMSNNTSMRWDIEHTRQLVGYEPQDGVSQ